RSRWLVSSGYLNAECGTRSAECLTPSVRGGMTDRSRWLVSSGLRRSMEYGTPTLGPRDRLESPVNRQAPSKGPRGGLESLPYMGWALAGLCRLVSDNVMTHFQCLGG